MTDTTLTIRLPSALKAEFLAAAQESDFTAAELIQDFMRDFAMGDLPQPLDGEYWAFVAEKIELAEEDIRAGRVYSSEEVEAYFAKKRAGLAVEILDKAA